MSAKRASGAFGLSVFVVILIMYYAPQIGIVLPPLSEMGILAILLGFVAGVVGTTPFVVIEVFEAAFE